MSNPNESGTTAIQVSPADLTALIEFAERMVSVGQALRQAQEQVRNLSYDLEQAGRDRDNWHQDYVNQSQVVGDLRNKLSLLETQNAGTEEELERVRVSLASITDANHANENTIQHLRDDIRALNTALERRTTERDDAQFKHLEVSEALAEANAKLDKFRELLGVVVGAPAPSVVQERRADPQTTTTTSAEPSPVSEPKPSTFIPYGGSYPDYGSSVDTSGGAGEALVDHQNEMPVKDKRAAEGPSAYPSKEDQDRREDGLSAFPSPAPTVEPSPKLDGTEHGSSDPKVSFGDPWKPNY